MVLKFIGQEIQTCQECFNGGTYPNVRISDIYSTENKGKKVYLTNINSVRFFSKVTPSNKLLIDTKVNKFHRGLAECNGMRVLEKNSL